jgi:hypothetical protein
VNELYRPSDRCLSEKLVPTFTDRGCHVVSVTDPYGRILVFLDRTVYNLHLKYWGKRDRNGAPKTNVFASGSPVANPD